MNRNGKSLAVLPDGHRRRMSDGKNAWRKMNDEQRLKYLEWIGLPVDGRAQVLLNRAWEEA